MRIGAHHLGHHLHQLLDVLAAIDGHAGPGRQAGIERAVIGLGRFLFGRNIGAVIGIGEFVIVGFRAPGRPPPRAFARTAVSGSSCL